MTELFTSFDWLLLLRELAVALPLAFLAGFVDSVAGGGGVISIPGYLLAGLPMQLAYGTNKFVACFGTGAAAIKFLRSGKVPLKTALIAALGAGSAATVCTVLMLKFIPEDVYQIILVILLPIIAVFMSLKRDFGETKKERCFSALKSGLFALLIGILVGGYDGLIGPGTGVFFILAFVSVLGMDLISASGTAKVANFASGLASTIVCLIESKIVWSVAIPCLCISVLGNTLGARYALKGGSKNVRKVMFLVLGLLFVKILLQMTGKIDF